jgi:hypothetical protein
VVVVVVAGCGLAVTTAARDARPSSIRVACGVERWRVKTLEDRPALLPAKLVTVRYLVTRRAPSYLPSTRLPFQRHVFTVFAAVALARPEDDGDIHVVLQEGAST